jgi:hypothetical protein
VRTHGVASIVKREREIGIVSEIGNGIIFQRGLQSVEGGEDCEGGAQGFEDAWPTVEQGG